ncbi:MAG: type I phosphomannose isomerase catalytic subunit [Myxococcota bacterium]
MSKPPPRPLLLRADNFTPPSRTPWGGRRILDFYKRDVPLGPDRAHLPVVGESWEVSVEPDFPSLVAEDGEPLADHIARDPAAMVGEETAARSGGCPLLIKLLDAADDLSVQIHPPDDYPPLAPDESGKPESWYVLHAEPDAGLYLGLREGVTRDALREALERGADVSALLFFVRVQPGDFFVIDAGTAHAIGRGVTLVEPQRVRPGRRGLTYRYWDWNRRYDADGQPDPEGEPRPLHLEDALAVTDWDGPRERALVDRIRHRAGPPELAGAACSEALGGPAGPVPFPALTVQRLAGTGPLALAPAPALRGLTVVEGSVRLVGSGFDVTVPCGRSAALPASLGPARLHLDHAHAVVASAAS